VQPQLPFHLANLVTILGHTFMNRDWLSKVLVLVSGIAAGVQGAGPVGPESGSTGSAFATPVSLEALDPAAFSEWRDGQVWPLALKDGPRHVVWTRTTAPEWDGVKFGDSKTPGVRHLRLGWRTPLPIGTVLARAGGRLSVLKPTAVYPGQLENENDWVPAQRLKDGQVTSEETTAEEYATWTLPPGTITRALRFTHESKPTDKSYAGWLGGVFVLSERWVNIAPQATAGANRNDEKSARLNNASNDGTWGAWDNAPETNAPAVSAAQPAIVTFTWPGTVTLRGLNALWAGFSAAEVQSYHGPAERHPREALESDWTSLGTFDRIENQYPRALGVNWIDFGRMITTRAIRLRITKVVDESRAHPHLKGNTKEGRRVWLGELLALSPLEEKPLAAAVPTQVAAPVVHPPIPIRFLLPAEGLVTLVIDDAQGRRVRNLLAETKFPGGENTAWWDGTDDLGRDPEAYHHGIYHIPPQFVPPGQYRVRGLWHQPIELRYEFAVYNAGNPPWETADHTGAWLANHTPPCAALFVPANRAPGGLPLVFLGSYVSEGGHGLAWVDLEGRKQGGVGWVGGTWTGAPYLARDDGPQAETNTFAYAAAAWSDDEATRKQKLKVGEIRLTALTLGGHKPVLKYSFTPPQPTNAASLDWAGYIGGLAVRDQLVVVSLPKLGQLLLVDAKTKRVVGTADLNDPRGVAFDSDGWLLALSGKTLLRFRTLPRTGDGTGQARLPLPAPDLLVTNALEDPRQLTLDAQGHVYISDRGASHQVKVFSSAGQFLRTIGEPGAPKAGLYDPLHLNNPDGLAVDSLDRLWVTENDFQPKRVSVWSKDGHLVRAFYGPSEYGGGGKLDPEDKTRFYYHGMEFRLDWAKGADQLVCVYWRPSRDNLEPPEGYGSTGLPEQPHYVRGRRYFSNDHNSNPTGGPGVATLWLDEGAVARPVAALGRAHDWELLKTETFRSCWPQNANPKGDYWQNATLFVWSDLNGDGQAQPDEVQMLKAVTGSISVAPDLSFVASRVGTNVMRYAPQRFTAKGVPVYDLAKGLILATGAQGPASSGGDQALWHETGWTILTTPPKPFSPYSVGAVFQAEPRWSYPSLWPGLHASHESPPPDHPGMLIGTTRLLGDFVTPRQGEAGPLWCVNGNQGNMYLLSADGLFVAELFKDVRRGPTWSMPMAQRGMVLNDLTLHDENFWPSLTQTKDGLVYLVDGARSALVRVDGLESIRRLPEARLELSAADLTQARAYFVEAEAQRQAQRGRGRMTLALREQAPVVDGLLEDWLGADWVDIDKSGVAAYFDSRSKPYDVRGAVAVAGDRLFAAFRTGDPNLLRNSGEMPNALFKTGGALDLMIGAAAANESRTKPVPGDCRLVVTRVKGKTAATLYRAVVPGTTDPVPFSSPWRTIAFDKVEDVSAQVQLAGTDGDYEISVPLSLLGLSPKPGQRIKGDLGLLRGNGFQTTQRVYWCNKASGITADVPSEAELTPRLWGLWEFKGAP
jgi:hypothetical protein